IKVLLKFFLNPDIKAYLREISTEFGDSTNAVRVELNRLVGAKLLKIQKDGRNVYYSANQEHPLYPEINTISRKATGVDSVCEWISSIGNMQRAYLSGDYACGIDSGVIDVVLIGNIDKQAVFDKASVVEKYINRKIRPLILTEEEFENMNSKWKSQKLLKLWG
ncbi:ArsR family transcriptional regulator, partial [bacterium]|nr:ArsR family transcriptional regulator [bacterium]